MTLWTDISDDHSVLDAEAVVVRVLRAGDNAWKVQSSHGAPVGVHPTKESAQHYAAHFLSSMIENAVSQISALEAEEASGNSRRWRARNSGLFSAACGAVIIYARVPASASEEGVLKAKTAAILDTKAKLKKILADL